MNKLLTLFVLTAFSCLLQPANGQDYSGLTLYNGFNRSSTAPQGQNFSGSVQSQTYGFANYPTYFLTGLNQIRLYDFTNADFDHGILNAYLSGFSGYDFDHASFVDASISALDFSGWGTNSFEYGDLRGAYLSGNSTSTWSVDDFFGADLQGATISGSGISSWQAVNFDNANLQGVTFSGLGTSAFQADSFQGATIDSSTLFWDGKNYLSTSFDWKAEGILLVVPEPSEWALVLLSFIAIVLRYPRARALK